MDQFTTILPFVVLNQTPEEFVFAWLHRLRCVSKGSRNAVSAELNGGIHLVSQTYNSSLQTLVTETKIFGSVWMMPYFTGAEKFLEALPTMQKEGHVDDVLSGMRRFSQLEVVQKESVEVLLHICTLLQTDMQNSDDDTNDLANTIELCAWSVLPCMRQFNTSNFMSAHIAGLCIIAMIFDRVERVNPTPLVANIDRWVLVLYTAITGSMRAYASDVTLQTFAVDTLILMMETLPEFATRFGEMLRQRGVQAEIEAAVIAQVDSRHVVQRLMKATIVCGIPAELIYDMFVPYFNNEAATAAAAEAATAAAEEAAMTVATAAVNDDH